MNNFKLENLSWNQMDILIKRGKYVDEIKDIWRKTWLIEHPYMTDCTGKIKRIGG